MIISPLPGPQLSDDSDDYSMVYLTGLVLGFCLGLTLAFLGVYAMGVL